VERIVLGLQDDIRFPETSQAAAGWAGGGGHPAQSAQPPSSRTFTPVSQPACACR
jgi:hypothetical protein